MWGAWALQLRFDTGSSGSLEGGMGVWPVTHPLSLCGYMGCDDVSIVDGR